MKQCAHCEHIGVDVGESMVYVGGQGYVRRRQCADQVACWLRWDNKNGG